MSGKQAYVYCLRDPLTGAIRYVGCTENPTRRLNAHWHSRNRKTDARAAWIRGLAEQEAMPVLEVLDVVPWETRLDDEEDWIHWMREQGHLLTNKLTSQHRSDSFVLRFTLPTDLYARLGHEAKYWELPKAAWVRQLILCELSRLDAEQR